MTVTVSVPAADISIFLDVCGSHFHFQMTLLPLIARMSAG